MTDRAQVDRWLADYVAAWKSYDRDAIAALFAADAEVRYHPYDSPIRGRDAIVESWFGVGDAAPSRDQAGTYDATYGVAAIDGDLAVATGTSTYRSEPDGPVAQEFHNCFLIRFDGAGRCREFTEWFMKRPGG
jgi:ketosteroid isomerase-like protein